VLRIDRLQNGSRNAPCILAYQPHGAIMTVQEIMTRGVFSCSPADSLDTAARIMWEHDCGCLPVVDPEGRVVGIITDRDICMAAYTRGLRLCEAAVSSVMARDVSTCSPDDFVRDVEVSMQRRQVRRVPVVDPFGKLEGIITLGDLARYAHRRTLKSAVAIPGVTKTLAAVTEHRAQPVAAE
jgi:CBS domain-containing protein